MSKTKRVRSRTKRGSPKSRRIPRNPLNEATIWPVPGAKRNWLVRTLHAQPGLPVRWLCGNLNFKIWFPSNRNPLVGSNEVDGNAGIATAQVRPDVAPHEKFSYCALVWGPKEKVFLVEHKSPPEMEIV